MDGPEAARIHLVGCLRTYCFQIRPGRRFNPLAREGRLVAFVEKDAATVPYFVWLGDLL